MPVSIETWMRVALAALLLVALAFAVLFFAGVADATAALVGVNVSIVVAFILSQVLRRRESKARAGRPVPRVASAAAPSSCACAHFPFQGS